MEKDDSEEIRYVGKRFKCPNCMKKFSKLVKLNEESTTCDICHNISYLISEEEYKRITRADINQAPRKIFPKSHDKTSKEEKKKNINDLNSNNQQITDQNNSSSSNPQTENQQRMDNYFNINTGDNNTRNPQTTTRSRSTWNNTQNSTRRSQPNTFTIFEIFSTNPFTRGFQNREINQTNQGPNNSSQNPEQSNQDIIFEGFFPFFSSPFTNNVNHHNIHNDVFDPIFILFGSSFNNVFRDNFSSNFRSNLFNDNIINIIIQESIRYAQEHQKPPVSKEAIEKLKRFKMNEMYCKKNEKGDIEQPICPVCQFDLKMEEETILVPCGHMYHSQCILPWFEQNNTCPVCRFELPPERN